MKFCKVVAVVVCLVAVIGVIAVRPVPSVKAQPAQEAFVMQITSGGTSSFSQTADGSDGLGNPELDPSTNYSDDGQGLSLGTTSDALKDRTIGGGTGQGPSVTVGQASASGFSVTGTLNQSFNGLNFRQQRLANHGNQFSVEPPDQGLCVGNGFVMEVVNDVLRVFDTAGHPVTGAVDLNSFYGYAPAIVRSTGAFGPDVFDPSCYFDPDTQRWFVLVATLDRVGTTSFLAGTNHLDIAVSNSANPLGSYTIYHLPVQNDGTQGTPNHGCAGGPCFGDYPHIGADANGIYLTTNEFNFFAPGFHGAQIYAIPKQMLAFGAPGIPVFLFDTAGFLDPLGLPGFTVWPATTPAMMYSTDAGGTEYFLSSDAVFFVSQTDNRIRLWGLSNTSSLGSNSPNPVLNSSLVPVGTYARPPKSDQKAGDIPLGDCINDTTTVITSLGGFTGCWQALFVTEPAHNEVESEHVDSNDSRMQQVVFANGNLWGALDTAVFVNGSLKAGVRYFALQPSATMSSVSASVVRTGVLAYPGNNLTYPALAVTGSGTRGIIAMTILGSGGGGQAAHFPSPAYVVVDAVLGQGRVQTPAEGMGPDDGFTSYKAEVGNSRNRWGDYGAAVADGNTIWIASEYIAQTCTFSEYISAPFGSCGGTRATLGNWATRISQITP